MDFFEIDLVKIGKYREDGPNHLGFQWNNLRVLRCKFAIMTWSETMRCLGIINEHSDDRLSMKRNEKRNSRDANKGFLQNKKTREVK